MADTGTAAGIWRFVTAIMWTTWLTIAWNIKGWGH
jgi:hypothetical protein